MLDAMMLKGRRGNARFEVLFCGKKVLPVTLDPALQTHLSTQKTCNCIRILGTWQFSSKAVIWLYDGVLRLARAV
jgi:hypothetical protein